MTVASMRAAEVGWSLYRSDDPRPGLDRINAELGRRELPSISARMYDHYGRLNRHGFVRYVPINELDMHVKAERNRRKSA
jgi:hypothetical protein